MPLWLSSFGFENCQWAFHFLNSLVFFLHLYDEGIWSFIHFILQPLEEDI